MVFENFIKSIVEKSSETLKKIGFSKSTSTDDRKEYTRAVWALIAICFLWGTTWIGSKIGVQYMPALQLAGFRQLFAGAIMAVYFIAKKMPLPKGKEWYSVIMLSALSFVFSNSLMVWGIKYIPAGLGSILGATFPIWVVLINLFVTKEPLPRQAILGFILGFLGICFVFYEHLNSFLDSKFRFGIILSLCAAFSWAFATVYTKRLSEQFNPYFSVALQMLLSGIITLVASYFFQGASFSARVLFSNWQSWASILYLVIFGSILSFLAYLYALQRLPTGQMSIYGYINPVVAILLSSIILNEKITVYIIIGGVITLLGVFIINWAFKKKSNQNEQI